MKSSIRSRRHRNAHTHEEQHHSPIFQKESDRPIQEKSHPHFQPEKAHVQTKLTIGQPGDKYEQEADTVAHAVVNQSTPNPVVQQKEISSLQRSTLMSPEEDEKLSTAEGRMEKDKLIQEMPESPDAMEEPEEVVQTMEQEDEPIQEMHEEEENPIQQKGEEEEDTLQTKGSNATQASPSLSQNLSNSKGKGNPLPSKTRNFMESSIGADFREVKIHTDSQAQEMNKGLRAQAFTHGKDVYFNSGKYNPSSTAGKHLLAHELTHVVQQTGGIDSKIQKKDLSSPRMAGNDLFERVLDNKAVIEYGDEGEEVRRVQQMLMDLGYSLPKFGTDGKFYSETKKAVIKFQFDKGLGRDGRVGFQTIEALDKAFPKFTLPPKMGDPWTLKCVLKVLCPWNKHLVESVMPGFDVKTFDTRTFKVEKWDGSKWVSKTFNSGGFQNRSTKKIGLLNKTTCEKFAFTVYHEGWHAIQASNLESSEEREFDAYVSTEQWSIDMGISGQTFKDKSQGNKKEDLRKNRPDGSTAVDEEAARRLVRQEYGGIGRTAGERVIGKVGTNQVRVKKDGHEFVRLAVKGDSFRVPGSTKMQNLQPFASTNWDCSKA